MTRRRITAFSNETIKRVRALRDKKHRRIERRFLAEGLRLLTEALDTGHVPELLLMADKRDPAARDRSTVRDRRPPPPAGCPCR